MEDAINGFVVEILKFALVAIVGLVVPLMVQLLRRAGLNISAEREGYLNQVALIAAAEVEEWASKKLKANLPVSAGEKMERALESVLSKIPNVTENEAKAAIHAALPQIGLGAAAGLKELGKSITSVEPKA